MHSYIDIKKHYKTIMRYHYPKGNTHHKALTIRPNYAIALLNRSLGIFKIRTILTLLAYTNTKQYYLAISDLTRAIELEPKLTLAYVNRGIAHTNLKEYELGIEDYNRALEIDPKCLVAYNNRFRITRITTNL